MSTATLAEPVIAPSHHGPALSPADYVRSLSIEGKEEALIALLEEVLELHDGQGPIFFDQPGKKWLGYWVTPDLAKLHHDQMMGELPPEVREEIRRSRANPAPTVPFDECLSLEQLLTIVKEQERAESP